MRSKGLTGGPGWRGASRERASGPRAALDAGACDGGAGPCGEGRGGRGEEPTGPGEGEGGVGRGKGWAAGSELGLGCFGLVSSLGFWAGWQGFGLGSHA